MDEEKLKLLGSTVADCVKSFMLSDENRRAFEEWYLKRYGKSYEWRKK